MRCVSFCSPLNIHWKDIGHSLQRKQVMAIHTSRVGQNHTFIRVYCVLYSSKVSTIQTVIYKVENLLVRSFIIPVSNK